MNKKIKLCYYRIEQWQQDYKYPKYLKTWHLESAYYTDDTWLPKDREHYKYKLIKLDNPYKQKYIDLI
jgi:hypothetical protein